MEIDDTLVFGSQRRPAAAAYAFQGRDGSRPGWLGLGLFLKPLSLTVGLLSSLLHFVFRVLRIPFPRLLRLNPSGSFPRSGGRRGSHSDSPSTVAERWVRELEEETGALCISKAALVDAQLNGDEAAHESEAGPSSGAGATSSSRLVKRHQARTKTLPDFFIGGYDAAMDIARREARVLCVVLTSEEHDDVPLFRREVLTDPEFVRTLTENQILAWGGDVRERDGYQSMSSFLSFSRFFFFFLAHTDLKLLSNWVLRRIRQWYSCLYTPEETGPMCSLLSLGILVHPPVLLRPANYAGTLYTPSYLEWHRSLTANGQKSSPGTMNDGLERNKTAPLLTLRERITREL